MSYCGLDQAHMPIRSAKFLDCAPKFILYFLTLYAVMGSGCIAWDVDIPQ